MTVEYRIGDCVQVLKEYPENHFDACVTDPPYGLEFMGKEWDRLVIENGSGGSVGLGSIPRGHADSRTRKALGEMQAWHETWAREVLRVLKPGAYLLAFGGTRTWHRLACALENAGFEIRDTICWLYGSGFPKSLNLGDGLGTALKPAFEPIVLARKPLSERNVAANVARWGTGALNIDAARL